MLNKKGLTLMVEEYLEDYSINENFILDQNSLGYYIKPSKYGRSKTSILHLLEDILSNQFEKDVSISFKIKDDTFKFNKVPKTKRILYDSQISILSYMGKR
jgi:hypothetical protein